MIKHVKITDTSKNEYLLPTNSFRVSDNGGNARFHLFTDQTIIAPIDTNHVYAEVEAFLTEKQFA